MNPQSERSPLEDKARGGPRQQNYSTGPAPQSPPQSLPQANGHGASDMQWQRQAGPGTTQEPNTNGFMHPPPSDSRNGRSRENAQTLPTRERSRNERASANVSAGPPTALTSTAKSTSRICKKCGESLTGQFVRALGGTFHLDCFLCRVCENPSACLITVSFLLTICSRTVTKL